MTQFRQQLASLPVSERAAALKTFVETQFDHALMLAPDEQVDYQQSFFDLGLTSLKVTEIRQVLEQQLDCDIDTTLLFSHPTVPALLTMLGDDQLNALLTEGAVMDPLLAQLNSQAAASAYGADGFLSVDDPTDINALLSKQFNL